MIHYNKQLNRFRVLTVGESEAFFNGMYMTKFITAKHRNNVRDLFEGIFNDTHTVYYDGVPSMSVESISTQNVYMALKHLHQRLKNKPGNKLYIFLLIRTVSARLENVVVRYMILDEHLPDVALKIRQHKIQGLTEEQPEAIKNLFVHL